VSSSALDQLTLVGIDRRSASTEALERLRLAAGGSVAPLEAPIQGVALTTCDRLELYLEGPLPSPPDGVFRAWLGVSEAMTGPVLVRRGEEVVRHLLRVACGLESAVVGEDQILAQVRAAYREACARGTAGPLLHRLFHAAFRAGKRVRTETGLADGGRSLAGAAVSALQRDLGGLRGRSVLVIGLGEMGELAARRLRRRGLGRLLVCNRTWERARSVAERLGAEGVRWQWRGSSLAVVDGVICATSAIEPVVRASALVAAAAGRGRPLVVVDLGMPRNVEAPSRESAGLRIHDLGRLAQRLQRASRVRQAAVAAAEGIIQHELGVYTQWVGWRDRWRTARAGHRRRGASTA